jgi:hypothetical protein
MGAASEGGYLGADAQSFFSAVVSGAAGIYIVMLTADAGISTDVVIQPGQDVRISGDPALGVAPSWGSGGFTVAERGSLSLSYLVLSESGAITVGGTVSLTSLTFPSNIFEALLGSLRSHAGASLKLAAVSVPTIQPIPTTGTITSDGNDGLTLQPADVLPVGSFSVTSGPCTVSRGGRCVGRRYSEQDSWPISSGIAPIAERCEIVVINAGALGPPPLFDTLSYGPHDSGPGNTDFTARHDAVGLGGASCAPPDCDGSSSDLSCYVSSYWHSPDPVPPTGCYAGSSGPPTGTVLAAGETITWAAASDYNSLLLSDSRSAHGGWELCFA